MFVCFHEQSGQVEKQEVMDVTDMHHFHAQVSFVHPNCLYTVYIFFVTLQRRGLPVWLCSRVKFNYDMLAITFWLNKSSANYITSKWPTGQLHYLIQVCVQQNLMLQDVKSCLFWKITFPTWTCFDTVDGWNPAPPGMYETLWIMG